MSLVQHQKRGCMETQRVLESWTAAGKVEPQGEDQTDQSSQG